MTAVRSGGGPCTIIIVNAIKPYGYEINNVLALQSGFPYRFRYRRNWVHVPSAGNLDGTDGLIILRDFHTGRFVPIRRILIKKAKEVGDIFYITYFLRELIQLPSDDAGRERELNKFHDLVSAAIKGHQNDPNSDLEYLVFRASDFSYSLDVVDGDMADEQRWGLIVQELLRLSIFFDIDFLRLVSVKDDNDRDVPVQEGVGYLLDNDTTYTLEIIQRTQTGRSGDSGVLSSRVLNIRFDEDDFRGIQPAQNITGRYDLLQFILRSQANRLPKKSFLILRTEPPIREVINPEISSQDPQKIGPVPEIMVPCKIMRSPWHLPTVLLQVILAAICLALYVAPKLIIWNLFTHIGRIPPATDATYVAASKAALVFFIVLVSGSFKKAFALLASSGGIKS